MDILAYLISNLLGVYRLGDIGLLWSFWAFIIVSREFRVWGQLTREFNITSKLILI